jgi:serine/threonine protein kinase
MIETGTVLQNRYRIEKQIGQGGMGKVYVATDERFKSIVAIKETVFEDGNLRKAFEREARLLNGLKHSALPRVSDHFDEQDGQFLVMEFIAGEDLAAMMETSGEAFPVETVLTWANQLCDALEYLHAQDIIHRDIKPQNLKLTPNGQIVLLDFGLAKGNPTDAQHQTAAKSIFGFSRSYASLEQIQGAGTEPRSDLYSLGATLYHLLTGIPPADALTRAMNVLNKQSDPLIPAYLVNNQVPRGVAEVLQRTMALDAAERPESARAMRLMLAESDKTIDANAAQSIAEKSLAVDFLTQKTKIMGATTDAPNQLQSEVQTKVAAARAAENDSYKTNVFASDLKSNKTFLQNSGDTTSPKRAKAIGATVFGGLLLIGSAFAAGYFLTSDSNSTGANVGNANAAPMSNVLLIKTENANISNSNVSNSTAELNSREATAQTQIELSPRQTTKTKNETRETKKQSPNSSKTVSPDVNDSDNIVVNDKTVELGDVVIDENGIRDKKTGKSLLQNVPRPNAPSVPPQPLTPQQMRRLEQLRERIENRKKKVIVIKTPSPQPTP